MKYEVTVTSIVEADSEEEATEHLWDGQTDVNVKPAEPLVTEVYVNSSLTVTVVDGKIQVVDLVLYGLPEAGRQIKEASGSAEHDAAAVELVDGVWDVDWNGLPEWFQVSS